GGMKRVALLSVVAFVCSLSVVVVAQADDRIERLEKGEVIISSKNKKGFNAPEVKATGLIKAPPAKVWALIEKCADYSKYMPRTLESEELSRKGNKVRCRVKIDMPFPIGDLNVVSDAVHTTKGGVYKRAWKGVKGDLKVNIGSWTLKPYADGKHTVAIYKVISEPKIAIPDSIRAMAQRSTLPKLFTALRKKLE
ncbi:MAG: hypothetical protein ACI9WU_005562, partial [Myxococcota bacterium]